MGTDKHATFPVNEKDGPAGRGGTTLVIAFGIPQVEPSQSKEGQACHAHF
jgi:hypothetical protein